MRRALKEKLIELVRGEEGVALVVTLALFFFLWLVIAGVYAVGTSVRERIHLQNAVDAAAYSAAVVQADTLSRIATINRAMSWTYAQMVRRQMDYIVYRWLDHTSQHYAADVGAAKDWATLKGTDAGEYSDSGISVNGKNDPEDKYHYNKLMASALSGMAIWNRDYNSRSFYDNGGGGYGISGLEKQIGKDKAAISAMNAAERNLMKNMPAHVASAVYDVLTNNCRRLYGHYVYQDQTPQSGYMRIMDNNFSDEDRFLRWNGEANDDDDTPYDTPFGVGSSSSGWYTRTDSQKGNGIQRSFRWGCGKLITRWSWRAWHCHGNHPILGRHKRIYHGDVDPVPRHEGRRCPHKGCACGACARIGNTYYGTCVADNADLRGSYETYYTGERAKPYVLTEDYFGSAGTITVGLMVTNGNPWASIMTSIGGIYKAFDHYSDNTVVFASAKAGYRTYEEDKSFGRNYRIDWDSSDEESWNLYTSDWDAVMVPVRMATHKAIVKGNDDSWKKDYQAQSVIMWLLGKLNVAPVFAGGYDEPDVSTFDGQLNDNSSVDRWRWYNWQLKQNAHNANKVQAKWQIQYNGARLKWNEIEDRMFH